MNTADVMAKVIVSESLHFEKNKHMCQTVWYLDRTCTVRTYGYFLEIPERSDRTRIVCNLFNYTLLNLNLYFIKSKLHYQFIQYNSTKQHDVTDCRHKFI